MGPRVHKLTAPASGVGNTGICITTDPVISHKSELCNVMCGECVKEEEENKNDSKLISCTKWSFIVCSYYYNHNRLLVTAANFSKVKQETTQARIYSNIITCNRTTFVLEQNSRLVSVNNNNNNILLLLLLVGMY